MAARAVHYQRTFSGCSLVYSFRCSLWLSYMVLHLKPNRPNLALF